MSAFDQFRFSEVGSSTSSSAPEGKGSSKSKRKTSSGAPAWSPKRKRREVKSFAPLVAEGAHSLILGTAPSEKSLGIALTQEDVRLRGGSGPQNYGHPRNCFFNIVGSCFGFAREETPYAQQVEELLENGYAIWDVLRECKRLGSLDSAISKGSTVGNSIPKLVDEHPSLRRLVFPNNSAVIFRSHFSEWLSKSSSIQFFVDKDNPAVAASSKVFKPSREGPVVLGNWRSVMSSGKRAIELCVLPSTSPAYATMRPPEKEKMWHKACFKLRNPPGSYKCVVCDDAGVVDREIHWTHDCPDLPAWRCQRKVRKRKKRSSSSWYF